MEGKTVKAKTKDSLIPENMLIVSSSPHIRTNESVKRIMLDVIIALIPAMIGSIYFFGFNALKLILISIASSVFFEAMIQKVFKKEVSISDYSAIVTGVLLAFNIPASAPWWIPVFGAGFAIIVVKQFFGGLGQNFMNPALAARAVLLASWPTIMTTFTAPGADAVASATPLSIMEAGSGSLPSIMDMFIGNIGGTLGETSALLLLIGGAYLIIRGVINWRIPIIYIGTTAIMLLLLGVGSEQVIYHILSGGLILGAFFMATDYASAPVTPKGQIIFALGAGVLTGIIRIKGGFPEGVSYSILLMNVASPLIDKFTSPKVFGRVK